MKVRPSVAIIQENKILLMRYEYGGQNVYNLPGGNAEELESIKETVGRELVEELQIQIEVGKLIFVGETHKTDKNISILHLVFEARIAEGIPTINPKETSALEVVWKTLDELTSLNLYPNIGQNLSSNIHISDSYIGTIPQNWF